MLISTKKKEKKRERHVNTCYHLIKNHNYITPWSIVRNNWNEVLALVCFHCYACHLCTFIVFMKMKERHFPFPKNRKTLIGNANWYSFNKNLSSIVTGDKECVALASPEDILRGASRGTGWAKRQLLSLKYYQRDNI